MSNEGHTMNKHNERAELIARLKWWVNNTDNPAEKDIAEAAAMLEAQQPALKPLTYIDKENLPLSTGQSCLAYAGPGPANFNRAAVYTRPHQQAEVRVPEGYVLVPVEPTDDMLQCAQDRFYSLLLVDARSIWDAML